MFRWEGKKRDTIKVLDFSKKHVGFSMMAQWEHFPLTHHSLEHKVASESANGEKKCERFA